MTVTIADLAGVLTAFVEAGAGHAEIFLSRDAEGNAFHPAYALAPAMNEEQEVLVIFPDGPGADLDFGDEEEDEA